MTASIRAGLLLHFYQPWWQMEDVLRRIVDECYRPIFSWVVQRPGFAFSANISFALIEQLAKNGHHDVLAQMRQAVSEGKIELFGTAAHHPILPLLSEAEILRQVTRDATGKFNHGLPPYSVPGFYLPEYAYSREIIPPLQRAGFRFAVMDDAIFGARHGRVPFDTVPQIDDFRVFLRSRRWGDALARGAYDFDRFNREFPQDVNAWLGGQRGYVVLATDAETFGHHHRRHLDWLLKPLVEQWSRPEAPATIAPFADLLAEFGQRACDVSLPPGSWSTEVSDFVSGNHFPLWDSSENLYHQALWRLVNLARGYGDRPAAEDDVLKILSSCCWWQVSGRPNFNPKLMMHGAKKALEVVQRCGDEAAKQAARQAFGQLIRLPGIGD